MRLGGERAGGGQIDQARRTSFGAVAAQYHAARPSYPPALVTDVIEYAGAGADRARVLEVGAGTGIATALFVGRGLRVEAIEPSAEMAAIAEANPATEGVRYRVEKFEEAVLERRCYQLIYSAQAWHWVEPLVGERHAAAALVPGGALACFWNRVNWDVSPLRDALEEVYESVGWSASGSMGPRSWQMDFSGSWTERVTQVPGLSQPESRVYEWRQSYNATQYIALLGTHSDHILLEQELRNRLFGGIAGVIESNGGVLELTYSTQLCLARAG